MKIDSILKEVFEFPCKIIKKIQTGLRCQTYIVEVNKRKYIFQIYLENTIYQAKKKNDLLKLFNLNQIPKAYKYYECDDFAYLITEFKEGTNLNEIRKYSDFDLKDVSKEIASVLYKIHSVKNNVFGWITNNTIFENDKLIDYIKFEHNRLTANLNSLDKQLKNNILSKTQKAVKIIEKKTNDIKESCLCWYDINPDNILIEKKDRYCLSAILDPGGARYGIPEWDLAFIKMEVCKNEEEFYSILKNYLEYSKYKIDIELLNSLTVIVELDDMAIRIIDKIDLPIPYDSNFKKEINLIKKKISSL